MLLEKSDSLAELLASATEEEVKTFLTELTETEAKELEYYWPFWARPNQLAPPGSWEVWLILAGRGYGKTRTGAEWVRDNVCGPTPASPGKYRSVALIAETAADARDVMVGDGKDKSNPEAGSGILQVHAPEFCPIYEPSKRRLTWPNGAVAMIFNAREPEQLRGPQFDAAWCDELAKWRYAQRCWDNLQFGLRLGDDPKIAVTTTPRPIQIIKDLVKREGNGVYVTRGSTYENKSNLAPTFIRSIEDKYGGTRLGRQELDAEILEDAPGALWRRDMIDGQRITPAEMPALDRIVVAIDPAVTSNEKSDETGLIVAGSAKVGNKRHGYLLEDVSGRYQPEQWARMAIALYRQYGASCIVAEANQGGDMVSHTIRVYDESVKVKLVKATTGKAIRAEPVSGLYEQGRVHHVGTFATLEDQQCIFTADFDRKTAGFSPDRVDALVWGITDLMVESQNDGIIQFYAMQIERQKRT